MPANNYFNLAALSYDNRLRKNYIWKYLKQRELSAVARAIGTCFESKEILDLGSGTGIGAEYLRKCGGKLLCVDMAPEMNQMARKKGLETVESKIEDLRVERKFDYVMALGSFEFVDCLGSSFKTACHHLKEDGLLVLLYPRAGTIGWLYTKIHELWGCKSDIKNHSALISVARSNGLVEVSRKKVTLISEIIVFIKDER